MIVGQFAMDAIVSNYASKSVLPGRAGDFLVSAETEIAEIFADAPADLRSALSHMMDDLRKREVVIDLPQVPVLRRRSDEIVVEKAATGDAQAILAILSKTSLTERAATQPDALRDWQENCGNGEVWVIRAANGVRACMLLREDTMGASIGRPMLTIPIMVTEQEYQRRGYGRALLKQAKLEATKMEAELHAYPGAVGRNLFTREGFVELDDHHDASGGELFVSVAKLEPGWGEADFPIACEPAAARLYRSKPPC